MPRVSIIKTNFTAGELSPRLKARVDVAKYNNGARTMLNAYPLVHGGAHRRPGSKYVAAAKNATKTTRLIPFIFKRTQAFILELGETYIRFFNPAGQILSGGVPYELVSPWDDAELADLKYVQGADTMFFAHPSYPMRKLVRYSNTLWKLSAVTWEVPPSEEIGERPATILTLSALTGVGVTATATAAAFMDSDVGRYIEAGAGRALITAYTSTTVVTVTVVDNFAALANASGTWKITESPKTAITPSAVGTIGASINLTATANAWKDTAQVSHVGSYIEINDGLVEITAVTSATIVAGTVRSTLASATAAASGGWALRQVAWNAVDGYPRAVGLFQQRLIAAGTTNFPNYVWGSKTGEYYNFGDGVADSDGFAFPLASDQIDVVEHVTGAKRLFPLTEGAEWSMAGGVEKPLTPTNVKAEQETAYGAALCRPVRVANEIIFAEAGGKRIRAMGYRAENDSYNAPDISVLSEHVTGDETPNDGGITQMAYQKKPDSVVWMRRADGYMVSLSIDRDQDSIGFARHSTDGLYESVAVIPNTAGTSEQLWTVAVRTINGSTVRYIERSEEGLQTDCCLTGAVAESVVTSATWAAGVASVAQAAHGYSSGDTIRFSDFVPVAWNGERVITVTGAGTYTFALAANPGATTTVGTAAKATTAWSGFAHLALKEVDIVADGYVAVPKTVTAGGAVTLSKAAYAVEIGLGYDSTIVTLPPEIGTGQGTAQGNALSIHEIVVRFYKSKGGKINGQPVNTRAFGAGAVLNQPIAEFTGDKRVENLGWGKTGGGDSDGSITILQDQPLPMTVLGVITRCTVNDG